jgi:TPR repeat protein
VSKDKVEAVKWYRKAAEQNLAMAQYNLGICYANGRGVTKDYVEAYKWFNLASLQDVAGAKQNLDITESRMTPKQITEAQRLVREFKPTKAAESRLRN